MGKINDNLEIKDFCVIVDNNKYLVLEELASLVKTIRYNPCFRTMLFSLAKYYNLVYSNFDFLSNVVECMPLVFLETILIESEIKYFTEYNNN